MAVKSAAAAKAGLPAAIRRRRRHSPRANQGLSRFMSVIITRPPGRVEAWMRLSSASWSAIAASTEASQVSARSLRGGV